jgi:hypothetical protein
MGNNQGLDVGGGGGTTGKPKNDIAVLGELQVPLYIQCKLNQFM